MASNLNSIQKFSREDLDQLAHGALTRKAQAKNREFICYSLALGTILSSLFLFNGGVDFRLSLTLAISGGVLLASSFYFAHHRYNEEKKYRSLINAKTADQPHLNAIRKNLTHYFQVSSELNSSELHTLKGDVSKRLVLSTAPWKFFALSIMAIAGASVLWQIKAHQLSLVVFSGGLLGLGFSYLQEKKRERLSHFYGELNDQLSKM
jgi:hypothetical protein